MSDLDEIWFEVSQHHGQVLFKISKCMDALTSCLTEFNLRWYSIYNLLLRCMVGNEDNYFSLTVRYFLTVFIDLQLVFL